MARVFPSSDLLMFQGEETPLVVRAECRKGSGSNVAATRDPGKFTTLRGDSRDAETGPMMQSQSTHQIGSGD